jgi:hypothetical protein
MTERIKELVTATDAWCDQNFPPDWTDRVDEFLPLWNEKFAELIIAECAKVSEDDITDGDACCTNTVYRIASQIKEHFGVEE